MRTLIRRSTILIPIDVADTDDNKVWYESLQQNAVIDSGIESVSMFRNVQIRVKQTIGQDQWLSFPSLPPVYLAGKPGESGLLTPGVAGDLAKSRVEAINLNKTASAAFNAQDYDRAIADFNKVIGLDPKHARA